MTTSTRERRVEDHLLTQARRHQLLCLKFTSPARAGVPDRLLIGVASGVTFVELKKPGAKPEPRQIEMHAKLKRFGARVRVVDDFASVDALIQELTLTPITPATPPTATAADTDRVDLRTGTRDNAPGV